MNCEKEYICNCGNDVSCVETVVDVFGRLIIDEKSEGDVGTLREICNHFDKFVMGTCKNSGTLNEVY